MRQRRNRCFADPRPHKLQATLRSAYVRLSQSRGAKLALLEPHAIPRPAASGRSRPFRCSSSPNCKHFAGLQFGSVCLARKSGQKEALKNDLWRLRADSFQRPVRAQGRYISDSLSFWQVCTTYSRGQTASISVLLISGIPDQPQLSLHLVGADDSVRPVRFL